MTKCISSESYVYDDWQTNGQKHYNCILDNQNNGKFNFKIGPKHQRYGKICKNIFYMSKENHTKTFQTRGHFKLYSSFATNKDENIHNKRDTQIKHYWTDGQIKLVLGCKGTMTDKLMCIPHDETQNNPFCRLQLVVETFG